MKRDQNIPAKSREIRFSSLLKPNNVGKSNCNSNTKMGIFILCRHFTWQLLLHKLIHHQLVSSHWRQHGELIHMPQKWDSGRMCAFSCNEWQNIKDREIPQQIRMASACVYLWRNGKPLQEDLLNSLGSEKLSLSLSFWYSWCKG